MIIQARWGTFIFACAESQGCSDWVRYSRNKKVRNPNGATRPRRSHSARFSSSLFPSFSFLLAVCPCSASSPAELPLERTDIHRPGMYRRNASVRRIEMFDHTRDWLILYFLAAFYFRRAKRDAGMGKNKGGKKINEANRKKPDGTLFVTLRKFLLIIMKKKMRFK